VSQTSKEIKNLRVVLDRLVYLYDPNKAAVHAEHIFVYFITISNLSSITVHLKGRRWIVKYEDGSQNIIDGDGIVGKEPLLATGDTFSYNSYHASPGNSIACGSFHGVDISGNAICTRIPEFQMNIPSDPWEGKPKEIILP